MWGWPRAEFPSDSSLFPVKSEPGGQLGGSSRAREGPGGAGRGLGRHLGAAWPLARWGHRPWGRWQSLVCVCLWLLSPDTLITTRLCPHTHTPRLYGTKWLVLPNTSVQFCMVQTSIFPAFSAVTRASGNWLECVHVHTCECLQDACRVWDQGHSVHTPPAASAAPPLSGCVLMAWTVTA